VVRVVIVQQITNKWVEQISGRIKQKEEKVKKLTDQLSCE
jgi:hypothetical protein